MSRVIDITGQRFGRLTVVERDMNRRGGNAYWLCKCDCGNPTLRSVRGVDLRAGKTTSCGCKNIERCKATGEDLTGQRFGFLTVLQIGEKHEGNRHRHWICRCDCGNITQPIPSDNLKSGNTTSCGCIISKGEYKIQQILKQLNIQFETEKYFNDLIGENRPLRFDLYLPEHNILIEYQGIQHFIPREQFGGEEQLKRQQNYDELKRKYCLKNNIKLLEIPYYDLNKISNDYILNLIQIK